MDSNVRYSSTHVLVSDLDYRVTNAFSLVLMNRGVVIRSWLCRGRGSIVAVSF